MKYKAETFIIAGLAIAVAMVYNQEVDKHYLAEIQPKGQVISYEKKTPTGSMTDKQKLSYLFLED